MPVVARRSTEMPIGLPSPSAVLLPTDGDLPAVLPPASWGMLAADALFINHRRERRSFDAEMLSTRFTREVALVRAHLAPIRSRAALAASLTREAFQANGALPPSGEAPGPVRVAYAIRWMELGDGVQQPGWSEWVAGTDAPD